jgi:hypothetical protein
MTADVMLFTDKFFAIEERLGLFDDTSNGFAWWDTVRYEVYGTIYRQVAGLSIPAPTRRSLLTRLSGMLVRRFLRARLWLQIMSGRYDVVVFRAPRQSRDGKPVDVAIDQLVAICPGRKLRIDTFPHYYHRDIRPIEHTDLECPAIIAALAAEFRQEFGIPVDEQRLGTLVTSRLAEFITARSAYQKLFAHIRPRLVLLTQNGIEKALFCAAREAGITVIESQHGLIGHGHPAYSYPRRLSYAALRSFPDYFLTFSDYWRNTCHYPAGQSVTVGNDAFYINPSSTPNEQGDVVFVSADIYHATLSKWLKELATKLPHRQFKYKLHPNQHADFAMICRDLATWPNVQVIDSRTSMRTLMDAASDIVLIQSTAAHEALQAGKRLCILPLLNYQIHRDLFSRAAVFITPDVEELARTIESPPLQPEASLFFERFNADKSVRLLHEIIHARPPQTAFAHRQ